jgi:hypothetical protein
MPRPGGGVELIRETDGRAESPGDRKKLAKLAVGPGWEVRGPLGSGSVEVGEGIGAAQGLDVDALGPVSVQRYAADVAALPQPAAIGRQVDGRVGIGAAPDRPAPEVGSRRIGIPPAGRAQEARAQQVAVAPVAASR